MTGTWRVPCAWRCGRTAVVPATMRSTITGWPVVPPVLCERCYRATRRTR